MKTCACTGVNKLLCYAVDGFVYVIMSDAYHFRITSLLGLALKVSCLNFKLQQLDR